MKSFQRVEWAMAVALAAGICVGPSVGCAARKNKASGSAPKVPQSEVVRYESPTAVVELQTRALSLLEELARDPNPQIRSNAIEAIAEKPARLEPVLNAALSDVNAGVRSTAAMMAGRDQIRSAVPRLERLTTDSSPFVRASAIYGLACCGSGVDVTPLSTMLLSDPSPRVRSHAAYLLGELGEVSALGMLRDAARASVPRASTTEQRLMQLQISEAMIKLGDEGQIEIIRAALFPARPEDLEAAALAVQIIGQVRDRGSINHLINLTAMKDPKDGRMPAEIRMAAAMSLAKLGLPQGAFIANEFVASPSPVLRAQAAFVYGQIGGPENYPRLEKLLADPSGLTQVSAAAGVLRAGSAFAQHP